VHRDRGVSVLFRMPNRQTPWVSILLILERHLRRTALSTGQEVALLLVGPSSLLRGCPHRDHFYTHIDRNRGSPLSGSMISKNRLECRPAYRPGCKQPRVARCGFSTTMPRQTQTWFDEVSGPLQIDSLSPGGAPCPRTLARVMQKIDSPHVVSNKVAFWPIEPSFELDPRV
jgi:hypothetical protein